MLEQEGGSVNKYKKLLSSFLILSFLTGFCIITRSINKADAKTRRIPSPSLSKLETEYLSPESVIKLSGSGFINNFKSAHKVRLQQPGSKKKHKARVLNVSSDSISVLLPPNIDYGDYELSMKLKTRFFKSSRSYAARTVKLRPKAPEQPQLSFDVINHIDQLDLIQSQNNKRNQDKRISLSKNKSNLLVGRNMLSSHYSEAGFQSLASQGSPLYYLPSSEFSNPVEIINQDPLKVIAIDNNLEEFDLTEVIKVAKRDLEQTYYLETPNNNRYLATTIKLSPVFIAKAHVKSPEFIILKNRSKKDFELKDCFISDSIKSRHKFKEEEIIEAKNFIKVSGNLGLNDTGGDSISLTCNKDEQEEIIDLLEYSELNEDGFAIKQSF